MANVSTEEFRKLTHVKNPESKRKHTQNSTERQPRGPLRRGERCVGAGRCGPSLAGAGSPPGRGRFCILSRVLFQGKRFTRESGAVTVSAGLGNGVGVTKVLSCKRYHCPLAESRFGKGFSL